MSVKNNMLGEVDDMSFIPFNQGFPSSPTKTYYLMLHIIKFIVCILIVSSISFNAHSNNEDPPPIGNFALPKSQRPGAFYSFGSKILDEGQLQLATKPNIFKETGAIYYGMPNLLQFGVTNDTSIYFSFPATLQNAIRTPTGTTHGSGMDNFSFQGEYEFFSNKNHTDTESADVIIGATIPSGSTKVTAHWSSYFVGGSYTHTWIEWILFAASGYLKFEGPKTIRPGDIIYFEIGSGRDIKCEPGEYNFTAFLELNGQYSKKDPFQSISISEIINPAQPSRRRIVHPSGSALSDGALLFITPSLWYSNQQWIVQLGVSAPIFQQWANTTQKVEYYTSLAILYTMN